MNVINFFCIIALGLFALGCFSYSVNKRIVCINKEIFYIFVCIRKKRFFIWIKYNEEKNIVVILYHLVFAWFYFRK